MFWPLCRTGERERKGEEVKGVITDNHHESENVCTVDYDKVIFAIKLKSQQRYEITTQKNFIILLWLFIMYIFLKSVFLRQYLSSTYSPLSTAFQSSLH